MKKGVTVFSYILADLKTTLNRGRNCEKKLYTLYIFKMAHACFPDRIHIALDQFG